MNYYDNSYSIIKHLLESINQSIINHLLSMSSNIQRLLPQRINKLATQNKKCSTRWLYQDSARWRFIWSNNRRM